MLLHFKAKKQTVYILSSCPAFLAFPAGKAPTAVTGILWEDGDGWQSLTYSLLQKHCDCDWKENVCPSIALGKATG